MQDKIKLGHTNKEKYINEDNNLVIKKTYTGFNHKLNYELTQVFDFVPKLIKDNEELSEWQYIEGDVLNNPTDEDLKQLGRMMRQIHLSDIKLPKNNLRQRVKQYIRTVNDKYLKIDEINEHWKTMQKLMTKMGNLNPSHNDIWWENIVKDPNNKLWLVDWEYATMGDKHFDLAYYIESAKLDERQEGILLDAYGENDDYRAHIEEWMDDYKLFVNWLTLVWGYAQDELPFPMDNIKKRINELKIKK